MLRISGFGRFNAEQLLPSRIKFLHLCVKWIYVEGNTNPETYWNEHELPEKFLTFTAILGISNTECRMLIN